MLPNNYQFLLIQVWNCLLGFNLTVDRLNSLMRKNCGVFSWLVNYPFHDHSSYPTLRPCLPNGPPICSCLAKYARCINSVVDATRVLLLLLNYLTKFQDLSQS